MYEATQYYARLGEGMVMATQRQSIREQMGSLVRWTSSVGAVSILGLALSLGGGCGFLGSSGDDVAEDAYALLDAGELPAAATQFESLRAQHPDSIPVGVGHAYFQLLAGDTSGAETTLASLEEGATEEEKSQLRLRRVMVAMEAHRNGDDSFASIGLHAKASNEPAAKLIAAEWTYLDWDEDEAEAMFRDLAEEPGPVGETAERYLAWMASESDLAKGLAYVHALWAIGDIEAALVNASDNLLSDEPLPVDNADELMLVWAGRAATHGSHELALGLLDQMDPSVSPWRVNATRAIIAMGTGDVAGAKGILNMLGEMPDVPADGLADARATACMLAPDKVVAKEMVEGLESAAVARCLMKAGAPQAAKQAAPQGILKSYLENR